MPAVPPRLAEGLLLARKADIETRKRDGAPSGGAGEINLGPQREQRGCEIAAEARETHAATLGRDVANLARRLEAMMVGLPPPFALIVKDAARVETQIAADRPHIAMRGAGDDLCGLGQHGIVLGNTGMGGNLGERHRSADLQSLGIRLDEAQLRDHSQVDEHRRRDNTAPDIDDEIGAAADRDAAGMGGPGGERFSETLRTQQRELRQGVHQARLAARRRFSMAANTRSGVTGRSLNRTPTASAMALVSAGRKAASDPSPASLAPNGPCGSLLSMMPTSMGGESIIVGTR